MADKTVLIDAETVNMLILEGRSRDTSFGRMKAFAARTPMKRMFEFMEFQRTGKFHRHAYPEIALCVRGSGYVEIQYDPELCVEGDAKSERRTVKSGDAVTIPAHMLHRMVPDAGGMDMVILYEEE